MRRAAAAVPQSESIIPAAIMEPVNITVSPWRSPASPSLPAPCTSGLNYAREGRRREIFSGDIMTVSSVR